jgi:hypothetical protein
MRGFVRTEHGYLVLKWLGVVDNGEGDDYPHGPLGSLHMLTFPFNKRGTNDWRGPLTHVYLNGPSSNEWYDGDEMTYPNLLVREWYDPDAEYAILIYESDPGPFREHDVLAWFSINRQDPAFANGEVKRVASEYPASPDARRNVQRRVESFLTGWIGYPGSRIKDSISEAKKCYVEFYTVEDLNQEPITLNWR